MPTLHLSVVGPDAHESILELNRAIIMRASEREFMSPLDPTLLRGLLDRTCGFVIGAALAGELAGYRLVQVPRTSADLRDNAAYQGFSDLDRALGQTARFAGVAVEPRARGQGIATAMCTMALALLRERGARRVITTCHPSNRHSLRMLHKLGFKTVGSHPSSSGHERSLLSNWLDPAPSQAGHEQ